jgi:hypothetical protein
LLDIDSVLALALASESPSLMVVNCTQAFAYSVLAFACLAVAFASQLVVAGEETSLAGA